MKIPEKLYHATTKDRADSIWCTGLMPGDEGFVYLADSINGSAAFLLVRLIDINDIVVFELDTDGLDKDRLAYSVDHNPKFFKGIEAYIYAGYIDPICINEVYTLYREETPQ